MKNTTLIILYLVFSIDLIAQINKVKNGGFEKYSNCPFENDQIKYANYWMSLDTNLITGDWLHDKMGVPEYLNVCAGTNNFVGVPVNMFNNHYPHTGNGMAQVVMFNDQVDTTDTYFRDYLQGHLCCTLVAGQSYCVTFFIALERGSVYALNHIGAYLDDGTIDTTNFPSYIQNMYIPQIVENDIILDSLNWTKVQGSFVATGNERLITIGNFFDNYHTSAIVLGDTTGVAAIGAGDFGSYIIDDISVIGMEANAYAGPDAVITAATDSVWVGDSTGYLPCYWYANGILIDSNTAGLKVHPTATTYYTMVLDVCGRVTSDTAVVWVYPVGISSVNGNNILNQKYQLYPNPNNGIFKLQQTFVDIAPVDIIVYNETGMSIYKKHTSFSNKTADIDVSGFAPGLYLVQIRDRKGSLFNLKFIVN